MNKLNKVIKMRGYVARRTEGGVAELTYAGLINSPSRWSLRRGRLAAFWGRGGNMVSHTQGPRSNILSGVGGSSVSQGVLGGGGGSGGMLPWEN